MTGPEAGAGETVTLSYSAGASVALVSPGCALIFAETPTGKAVAGCWPLVRDRVGVAAIVTALIQDGVSVTPGFALACVDEDGVSVVLRSPGRAQVSFADGTVESLAADGLATWSERRLGPGTTGVTIGVGDDLAGQAVAPAGYPLVGGTVLAGSVSMYREPLRDASVVPEPVVREPVVHEPVVEPTVDDPVTGEPVVVEPVVEGPPLVEPGPVEPIGPVAVEPAAVEPITPVSVPASPTSLSVTVRSVACPYGHLGPPYEPYCRICGTAIEDTRPFLAERPPLGLLRLSTGDVVPLDRDVILGRNPQARNGYGPARPHLVRLPSPDNDVSRTHVEIRLADWHVLVLDLGSTNGTTVTIPGQAPIRLRPHEPMPLEPNAEVNLADEIVFRYEVPTG